MVIIITGIMIIMDITAAGTVTVIPDITTFITVADVPLLLMLITIYTQVPTKRLILVPTRERMVMLCLLRCTLINIEDLQIIHPLTDPVLHEGLHPL